MPKRRSVNEFLHRDISIGAGDTHYIEHGEWDGSGSIRLEVDQNSDGTIDKSYELGNEVIQPGGTNLYLPVVLAS